MSNKWSWSPEQILETARSFQVSRLILTAAELDLFGLLEKEPRSSREVAQSLGLDLRATTIFLDALAGLGLLEKGDLGYSVPKSLGPILSGGSKESVLPLLRHMATLWKRWGALNEVLKTGMPTQSGSWEERSPEEREAFIGAMHVIGRQMAPTITNSVSLERVKRLLDVGGASGTYTIAFLEKSKDLRVTLLDLPSVIPMARNRLQKKGLLDRVDLVAADFEQDPLPPGHDMVFLSAIVHQNDRAQNRKLFAKAREALNQGGRILIRDHVMDPSRTQPPAGALFAVNMLVSTRGGTTYTFQELQEDLVSAGFGHVRWIRVGEKMDSLVEAIRMDDQAS